MCKVLYIPYVMHGYNAERLGTVFPFNPLTHAGLRFHGDPVTFGTVFNPFIFHVNVTS